MIITKKYIDEQRNSFVKITLAQEKNF